MTNLSTYIRTMDPWFIGFDRIWDQLERNNSTYTTTPSNYPPYDIIRNEEQYTINLAVAGFSEDDVKVELKDSTLTIQGESKNSEKPDYLHRGIASRKFHRQFTLAETVEVKDVKLENGVLSVHLENIIPDEKKPKKFAINKGGSLLLGQVLNINKRTGKLVLF